MTEAEWLDCTNPLLMLDFLAGRIGDRKCRWFACACCRALGDLLTEERLQKAVRSAELYADGLLDRPALAAAGKAAAPRHRTRAQTTRLKNSYSRRGNRCAIATLAPTKLVDCFLQVPFRKIGP